MFNNTTNTHKRQREENINGLVIENHNEPYNNQNLVMRRLSSGSINYQITVDPNQLIHPLNAISQSIELPQNHIISTNISDDNRVKKYSLYVGDYIDKLYELKDAIEFITDVKLNYELDGNIIISYTNNEHLKFAIDQINCLKEQMVLDKSKIFKAKIPSDQDIIDRYCSILELLRDEMIAPSVSYKFLENEIILKGPSDQLIIFIDRYNELVKYNFNELSKIKPKIYKRYRR